MPAEPGQVPQTKRFGALFCGGASRRMGRDKALLRWGSQTLLERGIQTLQAAGAEVFLASGHAERYGAFDCPCALDRAPGLGPLGGLEAALDFATQRSLAPGRDLLCVLACDMPQAEALVFEALCERLGQADVCLLRTVGGREPLFGVYRLGVLESVRQALLVGERKMDSFYGSLNVVYVESSELPSAAYASNLNTPEEYRDGERS